ncbi:hypothetical protein, partial [Zavarzinella formosa]|uniref:hypothetical protein n=1 Tax=Zavarzinella formosa TaxID=360055 RepID=UPI001EE68530
MKASPVAGRRPRRHGPCRAALASVLRRRAAKQSGFLTTAAEDVVGPGRRADAVTLDGFGGEATRHKPWDRLAMKAGLVA